MIAKLEKGSYMYIDQRVIEKASGLLIKVVANKDFGHS